jgi:hypothetical protein
MGINDRTGARQLALRKLGLLFARLDEAYSTGELDLAKELIEDVRSALNEARRSELGADNMHPAPPIEDVTGHNSTIRPIAELEPPPLSQAGHRSR